MTETKRAVPFSLILQGETDMPNLKADFKPIAGGMYQLTIYVTGEKVGDYWPLTGPSALEIVKEYLLPSIKEQM